MRSRRGMSPIVASILLVAITITIGVLVSGWISGWVGEQTREVELACSVDTNYLVDYAIYNDTGYNNSLLIKVTNKGKTDIYGFGAILDNGTTIFQLNSSHTGINQGGISKTNPLHREQSAYLTISLINVTNHTAYGKTLKEVRITNDACDVVSQKTTAITVKP